MYIKTAKGFRKIRRDNHGLYVMIGGGRHDVPDDLLDDLFYDAEHDRDKNYKWLIYGNGKPKWVYFKDDLLAYAQRYIDEHEGTFHINNVDDPNNVLVYKKVTEGQAHDIRDVTIINNHKYIPTLTYAKQRHVENRHRVRLAS